MQNSVHILCVRADGTKPLLIPQPLPCAALSKQTDRALKVMLIILNI